MQVNIGFDSEKIDEVIDAFKFVNNILSKKLDESKKNVKTMNHENLIERSVREAIERLKERKDGWQRRDLTQLALYRRLSIVEGIEFFRLLDESGKCFTVKKGKTCVYHYKCDTQ